MAEKITVEIDLDIASVDAAFDNIVKDSKAAGEKVAQNFGEDLFKPLVTGAKVGAAAVLALGASFTAAVKSSIPAISAYEKIENQIKLLTGSAIKAKALLNDLSKFSAGTPFQFRDVSGAATNLLSFGIEAEVVIDRIKSIGEVAAATNSNLGELALIFGQVRAAGKLTGERLLQLQERAVPIGPALAKTMGVAEKFVRNLVTKGLVNFSIFEKAFISLGAAGGRFAGALAAQSRTVGGVLSTLDDNFLALQIQFGKTFGPALIESATTVIGILKDFTGQIVRDGPAMVKTFRDLADIFVTTPSKFWANFFGVGDDTLTKNIAEQFKLREVIKKLTADLKVLEQANIITDPVLKRLEDAKVKLLDLEQIERRLIAGRKQAKEDGSDTPSGAQTGEDTETSTITARAQLVRDELQQIGTDIANAQLRIENSNSAIGASFKTTEETTLKASKSISNAIKNAFVNSVASSFQSFANNLLAGKNIFEGFGKSILGILGDLAISIGKTAIAAGITIQSLFGLKGAAAVAAGAGLIAIGSLLKAAAGGASGLVGGGGGGGATEGAGIQTDQFGDSVNFGEDVERGPDTVVTLNVQGDILDSQDTPRRLADLLNAGFDSEGIVLKGATT